jgi:hypothetical protein
MNRRSSSKIVIGNEIPWAKRYPLSRGGTHHANLRENRCDIRRYWRNRGQQHGPSRSLVRLPSSLLSSSLLQLLSSLPPSPLLCLVSLLKEGVGAASTGGLFGGFRYKTNRMASVKITGQVKTPGDGPGVFLSVRVELLNVCFWHLADIKIGLANVRFRG